MYVSSENSERPKEFESPGGPDEPDGPDEPIDEIFPARDLIDSYGTGFTSTRVYRVPGDAAYRWVRSAGPDRAEPVRAPSAAVVRRIRLLPAAGLDLSLPELVGRRLVYPAPGPEALANLLMTRPQQEAYPPARALLRDLGRTLRVLHSIPAPAGADTGHPGTARLSAWLADGFGGRDCERLFTVARKRLGCERWTLLRKWCDELRTTATDSVLLHGKPGTGLVIPSERDDGSGTLLIGEDMAAGPALLDAGSVLGELTELRGVLHSKAGPEEARNWSTLGQSFIEGYGRDRLPPATGRAATLCVLTHLRDYCAYVGWNEWWVPVVLDVVAEECDREGSGTLTWEHLP